MTKSDHTGRTTCHPHRPPGPIASPETEADKPQEIPAKGWFQIAKRGWAEAKADNVPLMAAGMAYYAFLAIFPAIIAAVLLYSFFADPATIAAQLDALGSAIPADIKKTITDQIGLAAGNGKVGFGAVVAILVGAVQRLRRHGQPDDGGQHLPTTRRRPAASSRSGSSPWR